MTQIILIAMAVLSAGAAGPTAYAVVPLPDGGYPGGNTAEGSNALLRRTTGMYNTAIGIYSLLSLTDGSFCTGIGAGTLLANTAVQNTATGAGALLSNTTGLNNTANGVFTLLNNTEANSNTANGALALYRNTTGADNTATGYAALESNTTSGGNTANGSQALLLNTTGFENTAIGYQTLLHNIGGSGNTALGYLAGSNLTIGDDNICIGNVGVAGDGGVIRIGEPFIGATYIAGISGQTASGGATVFVAADGKLGTNTSSARFKDEIKPMGKASEAILALKPVSFRYKNAIDPKGIPQFGLVAEEVERVNPDLVVRDPNGEPYTVRYEQINAMLLNEFLKEHSAVLELKKEIAALTAAVKQQAAQIEKVSAQIEITKSARRVVQSP
ncbi:MAG TPA: tail fiber domain-containing protein [Gammaproteobacteria bacterium]|nr:tail fiber domain-containing protein [Gammaproteobacteria bacterium]